MVGLKQNNGLTNFQFLEVLHVEKKMGTTILSSISCLFLQVHPPPPRLEEDVLNSTSDEGPKGHEFASGFHVPTTHSANPKTWYFTGRCSNRDPELEFGTENIPIPNKHAQKSSSDSDIQTQKTDGKPASHHNNPSHRCGPGRRYGAELSSSSPAHGDPVNLNSLIIAVSQVFHNGFTIYKLLQSISNHSMNHNPWQAKCMTSESNSSSSLSMKFWSTKRLASRHTAVRFGPTEYSPKVPLSSEFVTILGSTSFETTNRRKNSYTICLGRRSLCKLSCAYTHLHNVCNIIHPPPPQWHGPETVCFALLQHGSTWPSKTVVVAVSWVPFHIYKWYSPKTFCFAAFSYPALQNCGISSVFTLSCHFIFSLS